MVLLIFAYGKRKVGNTITLEMSTPDALKVQTSRELGNLSLLMRATDNSAATTITEVDKNDIDGKKHSRAKKAKKKSCNKGIMRIEDKDYLINCDGSINKVAE